MIPVVVTFMSDDEEVTLGPFNQGVVVESLPPRVAGASHIVVATNVADDTEIGRTGLYGWEGWTITPESGSTIAVHPKRYGRMFVQAHNAGRTA